MKKKDRIELKSKPSKELIKKASDFKKSITELTLEQKLGKNKNVHEANNKRKDLARILTFLKVQQIIGSKNTQVEKKIRSKNGAN